MNGIALILLIYLNLLIFLGRQFPGRPKVPVFGRLGRVCSDAPTILFDNAFFYCKVLALIQILLSDKASQRNFKCLY
jgi:hypothetical protein